MMLVSHSVQFRLLALAYRLAGACVTRPRAMGTRPLSSYADLRYLRHSAKTTKSFSCVRRPKVAVLFLTIDPAVSLA